MPIDSEHPLYTLNKSIWKKGLDFYEGEEVVKAEGTTYLPYLVGKQQVPQYEAYKNRSLFYDATFRTVQGLTGLSVWKEPKIEMPPGLEESITTESIKSTVREVLKSGRRGLLVDMAKSEKEAYLPYIVPYSALEIVNWREDEQGKLVLVVLRESSFEADPEDEYRMGEVVKYRELALDEAGKYFIRIWSKSQSRDQGEWLIEVDDNKAGEFYPQKQGAKLDYIPFVFVGAEESLITTPQKPPLIGVVNANLHHYRLSADYSHGLHWTALPTPWVSGVTDNTLTLEIGSQTAWVLNEANARAGYLEFQGQGLNSIKDALEHTERLMASIGARLLESPRKGIESAETARIKQTGEMSVLGSLVTSVATAYKTAGRYMAQWVGGQEDKVVVEMSTDFIARKMDPRELTALVQAYQAGGLSGETFVHNLKMGEILAPGTTIEDELNKIESSGPPRPEDDDDDDNE